MRRAICLLALSLSLFGCRGATRRIETPPLQSAVAVKSPAQLLIEADHAWAHRGADGAREAIARYQNLLHRRPQDPLVLWRLARAYFFHADYVIGPCRTREEEKLPYLRQGLALAEQAAARAPRTPECIFWTGVLLARVSQIEGVVRSLPRLARIRRLLRQSLERPHETNAPAHAALALVELELRRKGLLWIRGDLDRAVLHLQQAIRLRPRVALAWILLGEAYRLQGRAQAAREALRRAQQVAPEQRLGKWYPDAQVDEARTDRVLAGRLLESWQAEDRSR